MRDLLNDLSEGPSHPDPIRRAQIQMKKPLPKRFYKDVTVAEQEDGGFAILLNGKAVRTPAKQILAVPAKALGMTTVWVDNGSERGSHGYAEEAVDVRVENVGEWLESILGDTND